MKAIASSQMTEQFCWNGVTGTTMQVMSYFFTPPRGSRLFVPGHGPASTLGREREVNPFVADRLYVSANG